MTNNSPQSKTSDVVIVLGTRPEIIKMAPVIRACESLGVSFSVVHTGQHYSDELDSVFFKQLGLPIPDHNLEVGSKSHGQQTGEMLIGIEKILTTEKPEVVLVQGDTNSVLAGAIATSKLDVKLGHVEAGLRSFDRSMPEETNRVLADHVADYLFAPTDNTAKLLKHEGLPEERIFITGNTVVDAVHEHRELASKQSDVLERQNLESGEYILVTAHRAENVDSCHRFKNLLQGANQVAKEFDFDVVYPVHPRAEQRLEEFEIDIPQVINTIPPQDYLDFLQLEQEAEVILTDSGGIQEEACIIGTPCVTLRDNTERPETVDVGANRLAGVEPDEIVRRSKEMIESDSTWKNPFGSGSAADQIVRLVTDESEVIEDRQISKIQ